MYIFYNPHPEQKLVGDCVKRAFTKATGKDYRQVKIELNRLKKELGQPHFNSDMVWREYLRRNNFTEHKFPAVKGQSRMTVCKLAESTLRTGDVYVCHCAKHLVCVADGDWYDTWDSGDKCVYSAFKLEK